MRQKAFVLHNKGMNRDLSISKATESSAYENHNIRVLARDHDTMLSVTNERGNRRVILTGAVADTLRATEDQELRITENELYRKTGENNGVEETLDFAGILIGWNVLNNHVVLFTTEGTVDRIYRVDYEEEAGSDEKVFKRELLFEGHLGFDLKFPIESVVYHETEDIQKVYWVDGLNVLRFMNFVQKPDTVTGLYPWQDSEGNYDDTYFDSNRAVDFGVQVSISKDNSGNARPNGVIQYLLTYYNKHGQESGYVWVSDLVYLSPVSSGGSEDSTNNNSVILNISNLDNRFSYFRIYSVFRSALNGTAVAYIVFDGKTDGGSAVVVDNNSHLTAVDSSQLLYLGSQHVIAGTLTHKDQTLFLGNLSSVDRDYDEVEGLLKRVMIDQNVENGVKPWRCRYVEFVYSSDIPHDAGDGSYTYSSQLADSSSVITSFKGGEKYRFAIAFHKKDGSMTDAFWIGDAVNTKYPQFIDGKIRRVVATCNLPSSVVDLMRRKGYQTAQLMIAEATYADRAVKAQGIICPTVFNVWDRYMNRVYAASSWMMRPRESEYAWKHFEPIHSSNYSTGEIDCNYWETGAWPTPYYALKNYATDKEFVDDFDGIGVYDYALIIYRVKCHTPMLNANVYSVGATVILIKSLSGSFDTSYVFPEDVANEMVKYVNEDKKEVENVYEYVDKNSNIRVVMYDTGNATANLITDNVPTRIHKLHDFLLKSIRGRYEFLGENELVNYNTLYTLWCDKAEGQEDDHWVFFNNSLSNELFPSILTALSNKGANDSDRFLPLGEESVFGNQDDYTASYYKKHLMFVDENVVTLNSPEIEYEAVSFDQVDKYHFRIVGIAPIDGNYSDYTVEATPGNYAGEQLIREHLKYALTSWPLWREKALDERVFSGDEAREIENDPRNRNAEDYQWGGGYLKYWLHMWNHSGKINGFTDEENNDYSRLIHKTFANARFSGKTLYCPYKSTEQFQSWDCEPDSIRIFNYTSSQYVNLDIGKDGDKVSRYYNGILNTSLSMPGNHKYPVLYSTGSPNPMETLQVKEDMKLYLSDPVSITYSSSPHAVIALPTRKVEENGKAYYKQTILPKWRWGDGWADPEKVEIPSAEGSDTGALLPWVDKSVDGPYPFEDYRVDQSWFRIAGVSIDSSTKYVYIGEIYADYEDEDQIRYGGTSEAAIQNNRFVIAGPQMLLSDMIGNGQDALLANQGDTYIQRWDCLKTKPYSSDCVNNVVDITSVMLETHINIDGRTDLQRGTSYIASIDAEKFGSLNPVYSQRNNFIVRRDLDADMNLDSYGSSITWSLEKHDSADVDEWSHVTLASTLKLDGDKGECRALRRMQNTIIAFQDRGISEILFNSRTQLSTTDGVPVEIANSGKVDGKRYITNKYGCTNKWSIVEGKNALYFVDNINKAFCAFNGQAIENLSTKLGFSAWFREINDTESWRPVDFNNIVSYYDKIHSEVYLVRNTEDNMPCLVYNENLGAFTSFFDYSGVLMMSNVEDRFLSFKNHSLWLQNEGLYCNFFGRQYPYWMQYRVTPEPFSDKIWTNIDYRADFYEVLDGEGNSVVPEENLINGDTFGELTDRYKEWETFTDFRMWNEYQNTGFTPFTHEKFDRDDVRKKFRIWRLVVPRALREGTNVHGMDRIRNPWVNLMFRKSNPNPQDLMQLHDIVVKYFE